MPMTATELRGNLYQVLDEVLATGRPVEIQRSGRLLRIVAVQRTFSFDQIERRPATVAGDPDDLVHIDWSSEWKGRMP